MARVTTIKCDQCSESITHGYAVGEIHREAYATYENQQDSWDFCSKECLVNYWLKAVEAQRERDAKVAAWRATNWSKD